MNFVDFSVVGGRNMPSTAPDRTNRLGNKSIEPNLESSVFNLTTLEKGEASCGGWLVSLKGLRCVPPGHYTPYTVHRVFAFSATHIPIPWMQPSNAMMSTHCGAFTATVPSNISLNGATLRLQLSLCR